MRKSIPGTVHSSKLEEYEFGRTLGEGNFGKVRLAKHKLTEEMVAIKIMYKERIMESEQLNIVTRQIAILKSISHPNTIRLYQIIQSETELFLVMEYIEMSLMEYIEHGYERNQGEIAKILYQILAGIEYLHSLGIAHRDLKPGNILITKDKVIKIIDFGLSNMYKSGNKLQSPVGSPSYAAPQLIQNRNYNPLQIDVWSFGIIMYMMLTGTLPFNHLNVNELYKLILAVKFQIPSTVTKLAQDLIRNILLIPASKRFKIKDIRTHPWMYYHTKNFQLPKQPNQKHKQQLILQILSNQGFDKKAIESNIQKKKHNKLTALYHLYQRKDTSKLQKINISCSSQERTNETQALKTPRKIIRKPGIQTPRLTPRRRSKTPIQKTFSTAIKNKSYQTYIKMEERQNLSTKIQSNKTFKYIPSLNTSTNMKINSYHSTNTSTNLKFSSMSPPPSTKLRNSLASISRYNFLKKIDNNKIQSYYGPYSLDSIFTQKIQVLKAHILAFFKKQRIISEELQTYKFQIRNKKDSFTLAIYYLNGIENLLIVRVMGEAPEDIVKKLFAYLRRFQ